MENTLTKRKPIVRKPLPNPPNAIQSLRLNKGLNAEELGRQIGVKGSHIRRAERQGTGLGKANWAALARFFGVETWELHDPTLLEKKSSFFA